MWDHRVIMGDEGEYKIHEVYYNDDNEICGITENPVHPQGDTVEDLKVALKLMLTAFDEPILVESNIEYKEW